MDQQNEFTAEIDKNLIRIRHNNERKYTVGIEEPHYFIDLIIINDYIVSSCSNGFIYYLQNDGKIITSDGCHFDKNNKPYPSNLDLSDDKKNIISYSKVSTFQHPVENYEFI